MIDQISAAIRKAMPRRQGDFFPVSLFIAPRDDPSAAHGASQTKWSPDHG
jgi:hypothetical protein